MNSELYSSEYNISMTMLEIEDNSSQDLSRYSSAQEPSNDFVLGSWQMAQGSGNDLDDEDDDALMMLDHFISIVDETPLTPPAGRLSLEEALEDTLAAAVDSGDDDEDSFFTTHSFGETANQVTSFLPAEQRYQATLDKLAESMKRSQETRKSLRMKTAETMEYSRWGTISGTLSSIEKSSMEIQKYLKTKKSPTQQVL